MSSLRIGVAGCLVSVVGPFASGIEGQEVQGRVLEKQTERAIVGALVGLVNGRDDAVARDITDDQGRYELSGGPGSYRLRVERIGFKTSLGVPIALAAGDTLRRTLVIETDPIRLPDLVATTTNRCVAEPDEVPWVRVVWGEARKALQSLAVTRQSDAHRFQIDRGTRLLDNATFVAIDSTVYSTLAWTSEGPPFAAVPPERLGDEGFIVSDGNEFFFRGPDALTLMSIEFVSTHCFRLMPPPDGYPSNWVGLAFESTRADGKADIDGVLWLDAETSQIVTLEFTYVRLPGGITDQRLGGDVSFTRLDDGALVVRDWSLRVPAISGRAVMWAEAARRPISDAEFDIREDWGLLVGLGVGPGDAGHAVRLRGRVVQTFRGRRIPVGGAIVTVPETQYRAVAEPNGRFDLYVPPASLRAQPITVAAPGEPNRIAIVAKTCWPDPCDIELPTRDATPRLLHQACDPTRPETIPVSGWVVDEMNQAVPGAYVLLSGSDVTQTITDSDGWFFLCSGRRGEARITIRAAGHARQSQSLRLDPASPIHKMRVMVYPCRRKDRIPGEVVSCVDG